MRQLATQLFSDLREHRWLLPPQLAQEATQVPGLTLVQTAVAVGHCLEQLETQRPLAEQWTAPARPHWAQSATQVPLPAQPRGAYGQSEQLDKQDLPQE